MKNKNNCSRCYHWDVYNRESSVSGNCIEVCKCIEPDQSSNYEMMTTDRNFYCKFYKPFYNEEPPVENENYYYFNQNASIIKLIDVMTGALNKYKEELEDKAPVELEKMWEPTTSSETGELKSNAEAMTTALKEMDERIKQNKNKQDRINKAKRKFCSNFHSTEEQRKAYNNSPETKLYRRDSKGRFAEVDRY